MSAVTIVAVNNKAELDRFIRLPMRLYKNDPAYIPPLLMERAEALSPKKNPYFEHAETQFFLAVRDGRDVGRISAQIDQLVQDPDIGHFGMLAAEDDPAVFAALFEAAEGWLKSRGKHHVIGPFSLSINEETGLLVDGFDTPPVMLMGHDPRYADPRVQACGYAKAKDVIAYDYDLDHDLPAAARKLIDKRKPAAMIVRNLDMKRYDEEFNRVAEVFNDAWSENWGFLPFTPHEMVHMAKSLRPLIDPKKVGIVEMNGQIVGFGVLLPNLNEAIRDFNGSLLPFNWLKLLLRIKKTKTARVPLMGVRRSLKAGMLGAVVPFLIIDTMRNGARAAGMQKVELSWILEDNRPMRHIIESLGARPYKTYRVYEKRLAR
ncbi:MAG TPA: dATP pyrophosphohydrolase [Nevskiaceae bacterium]|nr:dATP pyrophosphohydrolase [Nevskiaceae bacterium]